MRSGLESIEAGDDRISGSVCQLVVFRPDVWLA